MVVFTVFSFNECDADSISPFGHVISWIPQRQSGWLPSSGDPFAAVVGIKPPSGVFFFQETELLGLKKNIEKHKFVTILRSLEDSWCHVLNSSLCELIILYFFQGEHEIPKSKVAKLHVESTKKLCLLWWREPISSSSLHTHNFMPCGSMIARWRLEAWGYHLAWHEWSWNGSLNCQSSDENSSAIWV